jgi:homoserine O-acetyltransferase
MAIGIAGAVGQHGSAPHWLSEEAYMSRLIVTLCILTQPVAPFQAAAAQQPPRVASVGPCILSGGGTINDCKVAYRTFGRMNAERSNVVLIPTWLLGRSEDWTPYLGARGYVDTTRFYAIVVDALGDGRSSSPSNVPASERQAFRGLTTGDMVRSQHTLLTRHLGISHLHAVVGFSMGGMQALDWAVRYPAFLDYAVSIAGTPRVGAFDHLMWSTMLQVIENGERSRIPADSVWDQLARLEALFLQTPAMLNRWTWDSVITSASATGKTYRQTWTLQDYAAQLRALRLHDISASFGSDLNRAAKSVRAHVLIIHSPDDLMVTAGPAFAFAPLVRADTLSVPTACGHLLFTCEQELLTSTVQRFLARRPGSVGSMH